jgi:hypothetical protein
MRVYRMERWILNARVFSARGGLPCLVMRVPSAPRVISSPYLVPSIKSDHFIRDALLVPLIHNSKYFNRFVEFSPPCT